MDKCPVILALAGLFALSATAGRINPEQMIYQGAFRLPDSEPYETGWYWGGSAMTYYPEGDISGIQDGYPGSIYGTGHAWNLFISEISVPIPVLSGDKNPELLNTAETLQLFTNVRGDLFIDSSGEPLFYEMLRAGMEYLPAQGSQATGKIHMAWGQHLQEGNIDPSHMWCELDLAHAGPCGPWTFGHYSNYTTCNYLFEIPVSWSESVLPGYRLATGRFRDGLWSGRGPALYAYRPWQTDYPAASDTIQDIVPLLLYGQAEPWDQHIFSDETMCMNGFREADEWIGGAWLTRGEDSAVILAGTKGAGSSWYGLPDGTIWDEEDPSQEDPENQRGWWCEEFKSQILFFDPEELAQVANGEKQSYEVQPYDSLNIDPFLFAVDSIQQKDHICSVCYDRTGNYLFIGEWLADNDKPIIHIWKIDQQDAVHQKIEPDDFTLFQMYPNPFNAVTMIRYSVMKRSRIKLDIFDSCGRIVLSREEGFKNRGIYSIRWDGADDNGNAGASGIYFVRLLVRPEKSGKDLYLYVKKLILLK